MQALAVTLGSQIAAFVERRWNTKQLRDLLHLRSKVIPGHIPTWDQSFYMMEVCEFICPTDALLCPAIENCPITSGLLTSLYKHIHSILNVAQCCISKELSCNWWHYKRRTWFPNLMKDVYINQGQSQESIVFGHYRSGPTPPLRLSRNHLQQ